MMVRDTPNDGDEPKANAAERDERGTITGHCDHCDWQAVADSHPAMVEAYQDHLREEHPTVWLRS